MDMVFNIIYTPGTAGYLSFFVWSLLKWTPVSFRLISNGCLPQEQRFLAKLCRQDPRLDYWAIPTKTSLPHGQALNYLQAMSHRDDFCFMDSDIFAIGNFCAEIEPHLSGQAGVFGGMPVWVKAQEEILPAGFHQLTGMFNRTAEGLPLGSTFFAVYNNRVLTEIMQATGIGFEEYRWADIPAQAQAQLRRLGLAIDSYDTGKLLNLLLLANDFSLTNLDLSSLCHIGGTSLHVLSTATFKSARSRIGDKLMGWGFAAAVMYWRRMWAVSSYKERYANAPQAEFNLNVQQRLDRRNPVRQYFLRLLNALFQGADPLPELVTGDAETDEKARLARLHLLALFAEFSGRLKEMGPNG